MNDRGNFPDAIFAPKTGACAVMKIVYSVLLALFCAAGFGLRAEEAVEAVQPSVAEVAKNVQAGSAVIVDVREQKDFAEGHLKASSNLPISAIRTKEFPVEFSKTKTAYLYCGCPAGKSAFEASKIMNAEGYHTVPLKANFKELLNDGYEQAK